MKTFLAKALVVWFILLALIAFQAGIFLPAQPTFMAPEPNWRGNFDGLHYAKIAQYGYGYAQQAFFPAFPLLIRYLTDVLGDYYLSSVIIANVCLILAVVIFSKLISIDEKPTIWKWSILALLFFPTSFFLTASYTESLFLLLVVASFYSARKNNWLLAGLLAALASGTRITGIFLIPALAIEYWLNNKKLKPNILFIFLGGVGLIAFMYHLLSIYNDPLMFVHVQVHFGQDRSESIILIPQVLWRYIKILATTDKSSYFFLSLILETVIGVTFGVLSVLSVFKTRLSYAIFGLLAYLAPTFSGTFASQPRYVLACFSIFILIGTYLSQVRPLLKCLYVASCGILLCIFLSLFSRGYWVA